MDFIKKDRFDSGLFFDCLQKTLSSLTPPPAGVLNQNQAVQKLSRSTGLLLALLAAICFIPFLGNTHLFDWDEINFAEIAREMVVSGQWAEPQMGFASFTEKPPLFFWLQAISMKCFGVNEFAARLPNALLAMVVLPFLYLVGKRIKDHRFGLLWALAYFGSLLPHLYFKSGIIDPYFNFFIFTGILSLFTISQKEKEGARVFWWVMAGGISTGLAILTKGPVALLVTGLMIAVLWVSRKFRFPVSIPSLLGWGLVTLLTTATWFTYNYFQHGAVFIREFTVRQWELLTTPDAGQKGFLFYHFLVLYFGCFPASSFMIHGWRFKGNAGEKELDLVYWMKVLFSVVLILFSLVTTKIVHYSSLAYYPLTFLAAWSLHGILYQGVALPKWLKFSLGFSALPFVLAPVLITWGGLNLEKIKPLFSKDQFALENLDAISNWTAWSALPGILLLAVLIMFMVRPAKWRGGTRFLLLFLGTALYIQSFLFFLINRIEAISQRAHIEFWESCQEKDAYYLSYGFKTYTYYYYGKMKPPADQRFYDKAWLYKGALDKPLYISCRVKSVKFLEEDIPDAEFLYHKNGFYFFKRPPFSTKLR